VALRTIRQHRHIAFRAIKGHSLSTARKLERELLSARRELYALQNDYLALGLQASQLAGERDLLLAARKKTEAYLAFLHPGRAVETAGGPGGFTDAGGLTEGRQAVRHGIQGDNRHPDKLSRSFYAVTASGHQQVVQNALDTIKTYIIPQTRLLEAELSAVRAELVSLNDAYCALAGRANTIAGERDSALKALHEAREVAGMYLPVSGANTRKSDQTSDVTSDDSAGRLASLYAVLGKTRNEKNDVTIQLAESEDRFVALQQQEEQLREEIRTLQQQLTARNEEQLSARDQVRDLTHALETARDENARASDSYEEQIGLLQQRLAGTEAELLAARHSMDEQRALLERLSSAKEATEKQLMFLQKTRETEQSRYARQEQAFIELKAVEDGLQADLEEANRRLGSASQARLVIGKKHRFLTEELYRVRNEYAQNQRQDRQHIESLELRLAELQPALVQANRMIEDLELAKVAYRQEAADRRAVADRHGNPGGWKRVAAGFVFLLGVIASLTKILDVNDEVARRAGVSREVGSVAGQQNTAEQDSLPSAETAGLDIAGVQLYGGEAGVQDHNGEKGESENSPLPSAQQKKAAKKALKKAPMFGRTESFNVKHNAWTDGEPLVRVYLTGGEEVLDKWYGNCLQGGGGDKECKLLEQNLFREGVVRLPGGVQYRVIKNGVGASPDLKDIVRVNFRAMLLDGTEFDSSRRRGGPSSFRVDEAIPGLQDVLQYMEEGARWEVYIPSELAFREPAAFGGQTVVFEIELVSIATPG